MIFNIFFASIISFFTSDCLSYYPIVAQLGSSSYNVRSLAYKKLQYNIIAIPAIVFSQSEKTINNDLQIKTSCRRLMIAHYNSLEGCYVDLVALMFLYTAQEPELSYMYLSEENDTFVDTLPPHCIRRFAQIYKSLNLLPEAIYESAMSLKDDNMSQWYKLQIIQTARNSLSGALPQEPE